MENAGFSRSTKYVRHAARETPKNATRTSAIYRFCFTKFMREMLRSLSKKVTDVFNSNINEKYALDS